MKKAIFILLALAMLFAFVSCENKDATCKVTYYDGTVVLKETTVKYGSTLSPAAFVPEKEGYIFWGWYTAASCNDKSYFDGTNPIKADTNLWSKWVAGTAKAEVYANIDLSQLIIAYGDKVTAIFNSGDYSFTRSEEITDTSKKSIVLNGYAVADVPGYIGVNVVSVEGTTKGTALLSVESYKDGKTYDITVNKAQ